MSFKKLLLGIALLAAAGGVAFCVKEAVDVRYPEYAVAKLTVSADVTDVPVTVAGFDWRFPLGGRAMRTAQSVSDLNPAPVELLGGETLSLAFSQPIRSLEVRRSASYSYSFYDIEGDLTVPYDSGAYLYEVKAGFESGEVLYYFYIVVQ